MLHTFWYKAGPGEVLIISCGSMGRLCCTETWMYPITNHPKFSNFLIHSGNNVMNRVLTLPKIVKPEPIQSNVIYTFPFLIMLAVSALDCEQSLRTVTRARKSTEASESKKQVLPSLDSTDWREAARSRFPCHTCTWGVSKTRGRGRSRGPGRGRDLSFF